MAANPFPSEVCLVSHCVVFVAGETAVLPREATREVTVEELAGLP